MLNKSVQSKSIFYIVIDFLSWIYIAFFSSDVSFSTSVFLFLFLFLISIYFEYKTTSHFLIKPPIYFIGYCFVFVYLGALNIIFSEPELFGMDMPSNYFLTKTLLVTNVAVHSLFVGFNTSISNKIKFLSKWNFAYVRIKYLYFIFILSVLAVFAAIATGTYGYAAREIDNVMETSSFSPFIRAVQDLSYFAYVLLLYFYFPNQNRRTTIWIITVLLFILGLSYGSKSAAVIYGLILIIYLFLVGKRIKPIYIVVFILFIIVSYAIIEPYRKLYASTGGNMNTTDAMELVSSYSKAIQQNNIELNQYGVGTGSNNYFDSFVGRLSHVIPLADAIRYTDAHAEENFLPYDSQLYHTLLFPLYALVPRFILPAKPMALFGRWFSKEVENGSEFTSTEITPQGYAYMTGSYTSIIFLFFFIGILFKIIYNSFYENLALRPIYILFFVIVAVPSDLAWAYLAGLLKFFLIHLFVYYLIADRKRIL